MSRLTNKVEKLTQVLQDDEMKLLTGYSALTSSNGIIRNKRSYGSGSNNNSYTANGTHILCCCFRFSLLMVD